MDSIADDMDTIAGDMNSIAGDMNIIADDMDTIAGDMDFIADDMDFLAGDMDSKAGDMSAKPDELPPKRDTLSSPIIYTKKKRLSLYEEITAFNNLDILYFTNAFYFNTTFLISQLADSVVEHKYLNANLNVDLPKYFAGMTISPELTKVQLLPAG